MAWKLEQTPLFEKNFKRLIPKDIQEGFKKQIQKLLNDNPYNSQQISYKYFREKKIRK